MIGRISDTGGCRAGSGQWTWLFAGRTVYLVAPSEDRTQNSLETVHSMRVLHCKGAVGPLLEQYLAEQSALGPEPSITVA